MMEPESPTIAEEIKRALRRLFYATVVLYAITIGLLIYVFVLARDTARTTDRTTAAVCAFRNDLIQRNQQTQQFLITHPHGFADIPKNVLVQNVKNANRTIKSLRNLPCAKTEQPETG
jgi:hypothetical protein